jgi:hypothetical protein
LEGLEQGYGARTSGDSSMHIPSADIFWMNIFGDLEDLEQAFNLDGKYDNVTRFAIPFFYRHYGKSKTLLTCAFG